MTPAILRQRTAEFASRTRTFTKPLLHRRDLGDAPDQLMRASASLAANYRAVCCAPTNPSFRAKLSLVLEEADECVYWTEYLHEAGLAGPVLEALIDEAGQLARIFSASVRTANQRATTRRPPRRRPRRRRRQAP